MPTPTYQLFVGVDIAAKTATIAWQSLDQPARRPVTIAQTPTGFTQVVAHLAATRVPPAATLVVFEATGSYWMRLASFLHTGGYVVSVINPKQAHDFAKATLRRAKTDELDAQLLADLAHQLQPPPWSPPPQIYHELQQRLAQRDGLITIRTQLLNQLHALLHEQVTIASVVTRQQELITQLDHAIAALDAEIAGLLQPGEAWAASIVRLQTVPGVGRITAAWVVVATANFTGCANAAAASAFAGLAPHVHRSGTSVRGRAQIGWGGDTRLRTALYMASVSAIRWNPQLKAFYTRLRAAGKPAKVALCAVARKLLHVLWALGTKQCTYDPSHGQPAMGSSGAPAQAA